MKKGCEVSPHARWVARMVEHGGAIATARRQSDRVYRFHHNCPFALLGLFIGDRILVNLRAWSTPYMHHPIDGESVAEVVGFALPLILPAVALEVVIEDKLEDEIFFGLHLLRDEPQPFQPFEFPWRRSRR
jgi:hypothetical protein